MKYIQLRKPTITNARVIENTPKLEDRIFNYRKFLLTLLDGEPQGLTTIQLKQNLAMLTKLEKAGDESVLELEDAEHAYLKQRIENHRWMFADQVFVDFTDAISNASSETPAHLNGKSKATAKA